MVLTNMFMIEYKDIGWWYWLVTAILLTFGVIGEYLGFVLAIGLTIFQLIHYAFREYGIKAFPVQVRFWYLILLIVSLPEFMQWLFWVPCNRYMGTNNIRVLRNGPPCISVAVE